MERITVDDQTGKVKQLENAAPTNIMDIEKMLGEKIEGTPEENDKLFKEIKDMSDEDLRKAVAEESTTILDGDGAAPKKVSFDPMAVELKKIDPTDMLKLVDLAVKIKANQSFNPVPEIPKSIYSLISMQGKMAGWNTSQIAAYAKYMVTELVDEFDFEKELNLDELQDVFKDSAAIINGSILFVAQPWELKKKYEDEFIADANTNETYTEEQRKERLSISKAFTQSYTLERQMELLKDDKFVQKLPKLLKKKFNRMCDDFDYLLSKTQVRPTSVKEIMELMDHIVKVSQSQKMIYILFLCELVKNARFDDRAASMFMYASIYNIRTLASTGHLKDTKSFDEEETIAFVKERVGYIKAFFEELERRNNYFTHILENQLLSSIGHR